MASLARRYPSLTELYSIGQSFEGVNLRMRIPAPTKKQEADIISTSASIVCRRGFIEAQGHSWKLPPCFRLPLGRDVHSESQSRLHGCWLNK